MLTTYIQTAMHMAQHEILSDDSAYFGFIPDFHGVWANRDTIEKCRDELQEVWERV